MEKTIKYKCTNCMLEEDIPREVVEYFDKIDPDLRTVIIHLIENIYLNKKIILKI